MHENNERGKNRLHLMQKVLDFVLEKKIDSRKFVFLDLSYFNA
jgi:hypothetical protein